MKSPLQQLIERCRRQQEQLPQFQPDAEWATEEEALGEWRSRTLEHWGYFGWYEEEEFQLSA